MSELPLRLSIFIAVLLAMLMWEQLAAARPSTGNGWRRRSTNVLLALFGAGIMRVLMPAGLAAVAYQAAKHDVGLLRYLPSPAALSWVLGVVILDVAVYFQHRLFHRAAVLWRLHAVHHADSGFDVTTGIRFHPVEILLSSAWKGAIVILLGIPVGAVVLFEVILSTTALFNHGNVRFSDRIEPWVRWLLVTPTLHRIHHSLVRDERDCNYGFSVSLWDRLFGTFRGAARASDRDIGIGLPGIPAGRAGSIVEMLLLPLQMPQPRTPNDTV